MSFRGLDHARLIPRLRQRLTTDSFFQPLAYVNFLGFGISYLVISALRFQGSSSPCQYHHRNHSRLIQADSGINSRTATAHCGPVFRIVIPFTSCGRTTVCRLNNAIPPRFSRRLFSTSVPNLCGCLPRFATSTRTPQSTTKSMKP